MRVLTLPNIKDGIDYLLVPDWEVLSDPKAWAMALGQALFSLSLAGSGMVVYGSYLKDDINIPKAAIQTAIFSSLGALLCAFVVIPAVFAFGISAKAGPPLVFISIPLVFQKMPFGYFFSILFNISILFAAVSSLINLMECPIEALENRLKLSRKAAVISIGIIMIAVGIFIEKAEKVGSWMDFVSVYIVPTGAMLSGIMTFWIFGMKTFRENVEKGMDKPLPKWFDFMSKYVFVGVSVLILILSITLGGF
ncbi:sodium-dependent transporter [Brachyspira intermedia]